MRRSIALVAFALPLSFILLTHGCGSGEPPLEDLCGWLGDPGNCYRAFFHDVGSWCGGDIESGKGPKGSFVDPEKLDVCIITEGDGGSVTFDPPLGEAVFPLTSVSFSRTISNGNPCGSVAVAASNSFSVTIEPYSPGGAGAEANTIAGGTFSITPAPQRSTVDTSCPGGETHHFNALQAAQCSSVAALLPRAEIESRAPSYDAEGFVRVRIYYPPVTGFPEGGLTPEQNAEGETTPIKPVAVEYFDCAIAKAIKPCENGLQEEGETDVDCGGLEGPEGSDPGIFCPRCIGGQACLRNDDCYGNAQCIVDPETGAKKCEDLCKNMVRNEDIGETDVDCGGPSCVRCESSKNCKASSDCKSPYSCFGGVCSDICINEQLDPGSKETDIDCGGPTCPKCADGKNCLADSDCNAGSLCTMGVCTAQQ